MAIQATMNGARLSYVVVPIEGQVTRPVYKYTKDAGLKTIDQKQDGGFMVYFPRGHAVRIRDKAELRQYGLHKKAKIINLQGLSDPNSPLGQLMQSQDEGERSTAMDRLEKEVIALATGKSGPIIVHENVTDKKEDPDELKITVARTVRITPRTRRTAAPEKRVTA